MNGHFGMVGANMAEKFNEIDPSRLYDPIKYMKNEVKNSFTFFQPIHPKYLPSYPNLIIKSLVATI